MQDVEVARNKTYLLLENKKQNTFVSENNLKSTWFPWIHKGPPQGEMVRNPLKNKKTKI